MTRPFCAMEASLQYTVMSQGNSDQSGVSQRPQMYCDSRIRLFSASLVDQQTQIEWAPKYEQTEKQSQIEEQHPSVALS